MTGHDKTVGHLSQGKVLELQRWNTPSVFNGWEQITRQDTSVYGYNPEATHDFMPHLGSMAGYAVTLVIEPSHPEHRKSGLRAWGEYRKYVASVPGPKVVVVQDLDKPATVGSFWGEVNSTVHRALGCVGTITDGAVRDLDEMTAVGFKALARRLCVGHAFAWPVRWNCAVEIFGRKVMPGQFIHADKHGFLVIPEEDEIDLLDAIRFMDSNELDTIIAAARNSSGKPMEQILTEIDAAEKDFGRAARAKFGKKGEW